MKKALAQTAKPLHEVLFSQGFGTRRVCWGLIEQGWVQIGCSPLDLALAKNPAAPVRLADLYFRVNLPEYQYIIWPYQQRATIALHKPAGHECSHKPSAWPSVYSLLPAPLRLRAGTGSMAGVQAVGRLDQDTTGLLILSDDGALIHALSSPKHHAPKVYNIACKHKVSDEAIQRLLNGVVLDDDPRPVKAAVCERLPNAANQSEGAQLQLTLTQGKYHQVKRMIAAVGNRVETLHRSHIGVYHLPENLSAGQWCWLNDTDIEKLKAPLVERP